MSQSQSEAAIRRAGAVLALAAASALIMGFPAVTARAHVVLALHAILLLGCAAVLLSPAHGAVADLARRATALGAPARAPVGLLRWLGFAGIVLYTLYVTGDVAARKEAAAEAEWPDTVKGFLLFLMFLVGVWAVYLSMTRERGGPPRPLATAAMSQSQSEAAIRRAGAVLALAAASALIMGFPAVAARAHVVLALHAILLLGCAAVLLSPAHGAVADLARRATALGATARAPVGLLRWLGFVLYTLYVTGDVAARKEAAAEAEWPDTVKGFLLFLMFLVGVWAIYLSMMWERGASVGFISPEINGEHGEYNNITV
ncbi:uncharacterized protein [Miscanthus floridulus]|uniref:uncharacterized protein n=1 Tax=Miscanthus floridulus TaxID=154761 RepID=UPI003458CA1C